MPCWEVQGVLAAWGRAQPAQAGLACPGCHERVPAPQKNHRCWFGARGWILQRAGPWCQALLLEVRAGTWNTSSEAAAALTGLAVPSSANEAPSASTAVRLELMENVHPANTILALCPHFLSPVIHHLLPSIPLYKQKLSWVDRGVLGLSGGWWGSCRTSHLCSCPRCWTFYDVFSQGRETISSDFSTK